MGAISGFIALCWNDVPWRDEARKAMKAIRTLREATARAASGRKSGLITLPQVGRQRRGDKIVDGGLKNGTREKKVRKVELNFTTNDPNLWKFDPKLWKFDLKLWKFDSNLWRFDPKLWKFDPKLWRFDPKLWKFDPKLWRFDPKLWKFDLKLWKFDPSSVIFGSKMWMGRGDFVIFDF
ncbi:MAG: hypothetical protein IT447_08215 [Phycisphaerales bacterium]|nr:hypothetical protein [Phycisphaerales bacterium]